MAALEELYEALEKADAAGNTQDAREIANMIRSAQTPTPVEPPKKDLDSSILDVPVALGRGTVQGIRFIADAFGADNPVSNALRGTEDYLADLMSAQAKADSAEIGRIMEEAEDKGVGDQVIAAIKALSIAPIDLLSQALGTTAPTIVGGLAGLALRGGATAATAIGSSIGAGMGAGVVKSTIYDAVEDALIEAGEKPEVAKAKAEEAQEYTGDNWGSILAGTALGGLAGVTGIEKNIVGRFAARQAAKETAEQNVAKEAAEQTIVGAAVREGTPEALQGGQEQLAANLALQKEGFDVPTFRGVVGQATLEGLLGAGLGAGIEVTGRLVPEAKPAPASTEEEREIEKRELTPEEQLQAQLARQKAGEEALESVKQEVGADLDEVDADTEAALAAYNANKPKTTKPSFTPEETNAQIAEIRKKLDAGEISGAQADTEIKALYGSTDTGVGVEGGEQTTGAPDTTGVETPDATGVAGTDESVTPAGTGETGAPPAIDPAVTVKNSEESLQQKNDRKAELQQKLAAAQGKKKDVAAGKLEIGAEDFDYEIAQLEAEISKVEQEEDLIRRYEEVRQEFAETERAPVPTWDKLSADERMFYEAALGDYGAYITEEGGTVNDVINSALGDLVSYRKAKGEGAGKKNTALAAYEINRQAESNARKLELPRWNLLPESVKQAYLDQVASPDESKASYAGPSFEVQKLGFDAIQNQLRQDVGNFIRSGDTKSAQDYLARFKPGFKQELGAADLATKEAAAQRRAVVEGQEDQLSLGRKLPGDIVALIKEAKDDKSKREATKNLIEYLKKQAKGRPGLFDKVTSRINRLVAGTVGAIDLNTKIEYVDTEDFIADYDAKRDVIRVSNRGLNEVAVLHELVHASTVKTISDVLAGREKDPAKVDAVKRLKLMMNYSKKTLGKRYSRAYKNIYEFVAYAMSDPKFQAELQKISVPQDFTKYSDWKDENLWGEFVRLIADTIGLVERFAKAITIKTGMNNLFKKFDTKKLKDAPEDLQKDSDAMDDVTYEQLADTLKKNPRSHPLIKKSDKTVEKYAQVVQKIRSVAEKVKAEFEVDFKKATGKDPRNKDYDNPPKELVPLQKRISAETNKLRQEEKRVRAEVEKVNEELREEGLEAFEIDLTDAEQKMGDVNLMTPGYLGNLFLEVAGIFDAIVAAPPEGGILLFENSPDTTLPIAGGKPGPKPRAVSKISADQAAAEAKQRLIDRTENSQTSAFGKFGQAVKDIFTKQGYRNLVRKVQNRLVDFQIKEEKLDKLGKLVMVGTNDEINDINTEYSSAMALAQNKSNGFKELVDNAIDSVRNIMKATKKSYAETLADLQMYMTGLHGFERRMELFYRNVPLEAAPATRRVKIYEELHSDALAQLRKNNKKAADTVIKRLKKELIQITTDTNNYPTGIDPEKLTPAGYMYNALGYDYDVEMKFKDTFKNVSPEIKAELEKLFGTDSKPGMLKQVIDKSSELNREANYFTDSVENVINFYGYKHYFPFKGKGDTDTAARLDSVDPFVSDRLGGDFKQGETTFMGRMTDADNPFLQVFTEATKSAMRAGFQKVPHAMKNLINQKEVAGSKKSTITFQERSAPGFKWSQVAGENDFFVYKEDGSVDVYEINDPNMRRAFKGLYKTDNAFVDLGNKITSTVGSFHTRYNPAFAPLDFVRNLMTYAGIVGLKYGPKTAGQLYAAMGKVISQGGMHKTFIFSKAFNEGKIDVTKDVSVALKEAGIENTPFNRDIFNYYKQGGQVAYMDSLTNSQTLENLGKELQRNPKFSPKKWNNFFDSWMAMFEITSRIAVFRTMRDKFKAENPNMSLEEAEKRAKFIAKDLANFQQVGEIGRELGSLFMFWRPAATGAIKAIDAMIPMFNNKTRDELVAIYKAEPNATDAQAERATDMFLTEVKNARVMGTVLAGAGMFAYTMAYMMAGEDDEGRNKAETDDMARWVRFARFNLGVDVTGRDLVFQAPWGFGPGAIASAGAQVAAAMAGGQDPMRMALNIASAGFESFIPLPISKIDPMTNTTMFVVDSVLPSVLRPLVQFSANTDGLGRRIYTDRQSRYADAYLGGDNVPAMYKDAVRWMFEASNGAVDMSPGTAYFFANNYVDGVSRVLSTSYNTMDVVRGQKEFDIRTDTFLLDSYFKAPANYDAIQFSKIESKIKELDKRFKALQGTPQLESFLEDYPMAPGMVNFYNQTVNGALRNLRTQANYVRRSNMSQKEKNDMLQLLTKQQNQIKRAFTTAVEGLETGYTGYEE
jgi:arsenate reductase-like glutaredoxin family protein